MSEEFFSAQLRVLVEDNIRKIPDFPEPGVLFRDITPLIANGEDFQNLIRTLADCYRGKVDAVAGIESRGFILGAPLAVELGVGMVTIRKAGRLPGPVVGVDYDLEYGSARIELQPFTIEEGQRILVVDDVLATGGTARASFELIEQSGGIPAYFCALIELTALGGRAALEGYSVDAVCTY